MDKNQIGKRLRQLRERRALTVRQMARSLNIAESTYRGWEYGVQIRGEPYDKIAKLFGVSLNYILYGKSGTRQTLRDQVQLIREELEKLQTAIDMTIFR